MGQGADQLLVLVWVDDITLVGPKALRDKVLSQLRSELTLTGGGPPQWVLQMRITSTPTSITLDQESFTLKLLERFGMDHSTPVSTPSVVGADLSSNARPKTDAERKDMQRVPYKEAVGALIYLSVTTRFDIAYAVSIVARHLSDPGWSHWLAVKRILRYLKGTAKLGLSFQRSTPSVQSPGLVVYVDSDYAEDKDCRRSRTGFVVQYAGGTVSSTSSLQRTVSLSTAEAEYMAAGTCTQEVIWFRSLLNELGYPQTEPTVIFEDNTGCIAMSLKNGSPSRCKHIDIRHHWLQEKVSNNEVLFQWIPSEEMVADILTKPLARDRFAYLRSKLLSSTL
jgi:hypothetical protein